MKFEWNKIHKYEENFEREIQEVVEEYVLEFYDIESVGELTEEDITSIADFKNWIGEYNVMQIGFSELIAEWESENED